MSRQKNHNIRLLIILLVAVCIVAAYEMIDVTGNEPGSYDRKQFSMTNTLDINQVEITGPDFKNTVVYQQANWSINGKYPVDPMRISVFFATMQNINIRRPASREMIPQVSAAIDSAGVTVKLFSEGQLVHSFSAWGDDSKSVTYFRNKEGEIYIVEIPGYRSYVYGLVSLETNEWRNKNVFNRMNWRNLGKIAVMYPGREADNFDIVPDGRFFKVLQVTPETDTTRLTDYIDNISLLNAVAFMGDAPEDLALTPSMTIQVFDVGKNPHTLELFESKNGDKRYVTARVDSSEYIALPAPQAQQLFQTTDYFKK